MDQPTLVAEQIRRQLEASTCWIPDDVMSTKVRILPSIAKILFGRMVYLQASNLPWPSVDDFAAEFQVSKRQMYRHFRKLLSLGLISRLDSSNYIVSDPRHLSSDFKYRMPRAFTGPY